VGLCENLRKPVVKKMNITLNNNPERIDTDKCTVNELLRMKNYTFKMLIIKINGRLIRKDEYDTAFIYDGDDVNVLHLISGG
jgi:sulfur carrier protein